LEWLKGLDIQTENTLEKMRSRGIHYLVGTPKGHLTRIKKPLPEQSWIQVCESVSVKILQQESEFYVYVESHYRIAKERSHASPQTQTAVDKPVRTSQSKEYHT